MGGCCLIQFGQFFTMPTRPTVPPSPFFQPSTPHVVVVQQTPGGTRRNVKQSAQVPEHKAEIPGTVANLINAIVGSGIVGIPYAIKQSGFIAGVFMVIFIAFITEKSLRILVNTAKHVHCPTYETAMEAAYGVAGFRFVLINMFITAYGAMVSYLMIVKDTFSMLFGVADDDIFMRRVVLLCVSLAVMVPLSSQRDMADLSKTSRFNVLIDSLLVGLVVINSPFITSVQNAGGWSALLKDTIHPDTIFVGIGVLSFAFVCQHSAFIIAGSLHNPTVSRWSRTTRIALSVCAFLATTCGVTGYLGYGQHTKGNILSNLSEQSLSASFARGMLGFTMLFVYPLESFVTRHVLVVLLFEGRRAHEGDDSTILDRTDRRITLTFALYVLAVLPAVLFEDLGSVLALTGAIGGSCLAYIGPGLVYMGIHGGEFLELIRDSWFGPMLQQPSQVSTSSQPTKAVETTPLVASKKEAQSFVDATVQRQEEYSPQRPGLIRSFLWYTSGMPIWTFLAQCGRKNLTIFVHEMALKSPHPIRIGTVEYRRAQVRQGRIDADPEEAAVVTGPPPERSASFYGHENSTLLARPTVDLPLLAKPMSKNQEIGRQLLLKQHQELQEPLEPDPQAETPAWSNFFVAVFYILFGILALAAGLLSIFEE